MIARISNSRGHSNESLRAWLGSLGLVRVFPIENSNGRHSFRNSRQSQWCTHQKSEGRSRRGLSWRLRRSLETMYWRWGVIVWNFWTQFTDMIHSFSSVDLLTFLSGQTLYISYEITSAINATSIVATRREQLNSIRAFQLSYRENDVLISN